MTHDLIHDALTARADAHEQALSYGTSDDGAIATPLALEKAGSPGLRNRSRGPRLLVAAAALAIAAVAGGVALGNTDDDALVGSGGEPARTAEQQGRFADGGDGGAPNGDAAPTAEDGQREPLTEQAARTHLEQFLAALNRQDYASAEQLLGGADMAADVAATLRPEPRDKPGAGLDRYCAQELTFCSGLSVTEPASHDETIRTFLVTTPIPVGALGGGEPTSPDTAHSTTFRVDQVNGTLRVLDLPPTHDDPWAER